MQMSEAEGPMLALKDPTNLWDGDSMERLRFFLTLLGIFTCTIFLRRAILMAMQSSNPSGTVMKTNYWMMHMCH